MAANINFELGNVWGRTRDVTVYGKGKSDLEDLLTAAAARQGRPGGGHDVRAPAGSTAPTSSASPASACRRSGSSRGPTSSAARRGWGEARYAEWIAERYHRPGDEVQEDWNYEGLVEDARLALELALEVAERDEMPAWYPGDEFEAERQRALAEVAGTR
jgi:hypothetical protein